MSTSEGVYNKGNLDEKQDRMMESPLSVLFSSSRPYSFDPVLEIPCT